MKSHFFKVSCIAIVLLLSVSFAPKTQEFQGQAFYFSKSTMELGSWGARMSEAQKKNVQARLKNRLEKTFVLSFNKEASVFNEEDKLDAIAGATDSWGNNFSRGEQYKNVKENVLVQTQEFYGKKFLVKDSLQQIDWKMGKESKQIGQYLCFKATALIPTSELDWYNFSWGDLRSAAPAKKADSVNTAATDVLETPEVPEIKMTAVEAWYSPQIPVSHGPAEYWGLPGLILEVSAGNTTMLCAKIVMNPKEQIIIEAPSKGKEITKSDYQETVKGKMLEMRNNRGRRRAN